MVLEPRPQAAELIVGASFEDDLQVTSAGSSAVTRLLGADLIGLTAQARAASEAAPRHKWVAVRAAEATPLWHVLDVLGALRGRDCIASLESTACWLDRPILDLEPALTRRPGSWDELRLGEPRASAEGEPPPGAPTPEQYRVEVEQARPAIRACLLASDRARAWMPDQVEFMFGLGDDGQRVVQPFERELLEDSQLEGCLRRALANESRELTGVYALVVLPITVPL